MTVDDRKVLACTIGPKEDPRTYRAGQDGVVLIEYQDHQVTHFVDIHLEEGTVCRFFSPLRVDFSQREKDSKQTALPGIVY